MVTSSIDAILQSSSFVNKMLLYGKTNAISVTVDMWERDYLDVIKSVFGLVEVYGNKFVNVVSMPGLCSPKRSLNVRQVWPMY